MSEEKDYFESVGAVFSNKDLLRIETIPESDSRIIGREKQLTDLASELGSAMNGQKPNNVFIFGKPGVGKSMCSKYLLRQLVGRGADNGISIGVAYVDCMQNSTETQVIVTAGESINDREQTNVYFPSGGVSRSRLYDRLWDAFDQLYDVGIIILDEIDKLEDPNETLGTLSRAGESEKLDSCQLGLVGISNKARFEQRLGSEVKSSLTQNELVFPPYDAKELLEILKARQDAFTESVLDEDADHVFATAAKFAAKEYGDARQAIDLLRKAGEIAEREGAQTLQTGHVEQALDKAEEDKLVKMMQTQPVQSKYVMQAVALTARHAPTGEVVKSHDVYAKYEQLTEYENVDINTLSWRRVRDLLDELEDLDVLQQQRKGAGKGKGTYRAVYLTDSPETVLRACENVE
ncbi:Cdc6/Cdc18 family protein [Halomarina rubra]|uniref:ORC1-type DNA replication protein n=1 Tax=Halomarina rubra TaxID=2071873 RepID=A0ABD6B163_9EURY|nr:AAA family ATPase [Halomarina rubra]